MKPKNKLFGNSWLRLLSRTFALSAMFTFAIASYSCKDETPAKLPTVDVKITSTSTSSISFSITAENAVSVSYAVATADEIATAEYQTVNLEDSNTIERTQEGLEEGTQYTVSVYATNSDGKRSETDTETATTTANASVSIEVLDITSNSVNFKLTPINAVTMAYAVVESTEELETVELTNKVDNGNEQDFTVENLSPNTNYTIIATATTSAGEESARSYEPIKTQIEPVITIDNIQPEYNQAYVTISTENAVSYSRAYTLKGEAEPDASAYTTTAFTGGDTGTTFAIPQLEPETEYTVYVYATNSNGYSGEPVHEDFTTTEFVDSGFNVTVSNITSTDAEINVTIDKELYDSYYFVTGPREIMCPSGEWAWNWQDYIDMGFSSPMYQQYYDEETISMRRFSNEFALFPESIYMAGGIPVNKEGELDFDAEVWQTIELPALVYNESDATVQIQEGAIGYDVASFTIKADDPDIEYLYIYNNQGKVSEGDKSFDEVVESAVCSFPVNAQTSMDTTITWLIQDTEYTLVVVPKDSEGKLGQTAYINYKTKSTNDAGDAKGEATLSEINTNDATFDITLGENAVKMQYLSSPTMYYLTMDGTGFDTTAFKNSLIVNNNNAVTSNGELKIDGLSAETDYVFGFAPVDAAGVAGEPILIFEKTEGYTPTGDSRASVEISITDVNFDGYGAWQFSVVCTPNEYVSRYWVQSGDSMFSMTVSQLVEYAQQNIMLPYEGEQIIPGMFVNQNGYVVVVAFDTNDEFAFSKIVNVEESWTE